MNIYNEGLQMQVISFCPIHLQSKAEEFSKQFKAINDFSYTWKRWKNWENNKPPIIISKGDEILGLHAVTFSERTGYVNSYYQAVSPELQGQRMGGKMVDFIMQVSSLRKMKRLKMKTPVNSPGHYFWRGFGLKPIGFKDNVLYWDNDINLVENVGGLIEWMKLRKHHQPPPEKELIRLLKNGVELLTKERIEEFC